MHLQPVITGEASVETVLDFSVLVKDSVDKPGNISTLSDSCYFVTKLEVSLVPTLLRWSM